MAGVGSAGSLDENLDLLQLMPELQDYASSDTPTVLNPATDEWLVPFVNLSCACSLLRAACCLALSE